MARVKEISTIEIHQRYNIFCHMAEREGFEPSIGDANTRFPVVLLRPARTPLPHNVLIFEVANITNKKFQEKIY
jgi:hypothetical protein